MNTAATTNRSAELAETIAHAESVLSLRGTSHASRMAAARALVSAQDELARLGAR